MTPQDWKEVELSLNSFYKQAVLMCDGYKITLTLGRISQFKNGIKVYVNNVLKLKWMIEECEERRRFFRPIKKSLISPKEKAAFKRLSKKAKLDIKTEYTYYAPYWTSFRALKAHLIKHNKSIELVREECVL
ncbi:hypothetical protein [Desulforamulus ruminis]|uniref:Uncharacterized protein n=1 Tax=Desulforamulus ruminis (strain ATCC 23193 / DSM 2154 / NCIMB 8452 / DL) TaxID=696281 RepID=F6DTH3_DESRL|nr:hypothetical protein [Desulforamulus ruminis]AEG60035.1 hypothetical protein Desru_1771 [Desulforamulus ruminis DSM 2154]